MSKSKKIIIFCFSFLIAFLGLEILLRQNETAKTQVQSEKNLIDEKMGIVPDFIQDRGQVQLATSDVVFSGSSSLRPIVPSTLEDLEKLSLSFVDLSVAGSTFEQQVSVLENYKKNLHQKQILIKEINMNTLLHDRLNFKRYELQKIWQAKHPTPSWFQSLIGQLLGLKTIEEIGLRLYRKWNPVDFSTGEAAWIQSLDQLQKLNNKSRFKIVFVVFPSFKRKQLTSDTIHQTIQTNLQKYFPKAPVIDFYQDFTSAELENMKASPIDTLHFHEKFHPLVAEKISARIKTENK